MTDEIINQAIESTLVEQEPVVTPQEEAKAPEEIAPTETIEPEDVPFPKKAVNALSRRDKQIGKLQAQLAAERAELAKYREQSAKTPQEPKEEAFDNYGEFLEAKARMKFEQEQSEKIRQQEQQQTTQQREEYLAERENYTIEKAKAAIDNIPEYRQLMMENADIVQSFPPHVAEAFFEADEPALAFLALAKEGKLDSLLKMSPSRVAIEIGKAEMRGEILSKTRPVTKAPTPIQGLKGTGNATKTINADSSWEDLQKWLKTK